MVTPSPVCSTPSTFAPVTICTFCLAISRAQALAMSLSSSGRIWSSASSRITSVPSRPKADATSVPEAPAPITASRLGCSDVSHMPAVSTIGPPNSSPATGRGTDPHASTTVPASISVPSKEPPTFTLPSSVTEPRPSIRSMPFFSNSIATPPVSVLMTLSRCLVAPPQSKLTSPAVMPKLLAPWTSFIASATRSTAFAGMQASLRQRPPVLPFSITAVFMPSWAARIAAT